MMDVKLRVEDRKSGDPALTFGLSHGRRVDIDRHMAPLEAIMLLAQGVVALTPNPQDVGEGLRRFANCLRLGGLGDVLDETIGKEGEPAKAPATKYTVTVAVWNNVQDVTITVHLGRGGQVADAWVAIAESIVAVATHIQVDPLEVLAMIAERPPTVSRLDPQMVTFPSKGGQA